MNTTIMENPTSPAGAPDRPAPATLVREIISRPPPPRPEATAKKAAAGLWVLVCALAGAAVGFLGMHFGKEILAPIPGPKWHVIFVLAGFPLCWLVAVAFHEFGHVIGGWLVGGRFLLWLVGPVMLRRTPAGIRAGWNRSVNLSGGLSACLPLDPIRATPRRTALMVLGGPVASWLLAVGALWLAGWLATWDHPLSWMRASAQNLTIFTALVSFLIFLLTVIPATHGGFKSDGKRIIDLLRGDARSHQEAAMLVLTSASLAGTRPAAYESALVDRVLALNDGSHFDLLGRLAAYYHAADRGEWSRAQALLDQALAGEAKLPPFVRDILRCEYAWLLASRTGDAATARAWLDSAGKLDFDPATRLRAQAAVRLVEGNAAEANLTAREGLHALRTRNLSPVQSPFAVDALEAVIQRAGG